MTTHEIDMVQVARRVVQDNGFTVDRPAGLLASIPARDPDESARDLRSLAWSSIDNQESRDLDQIEVAERLPDGSIRVLVGIADVDAVVPKGSPIDHFAWLNTVSLYTGVHTFAMLPEELSTDRTSLLADGKDRLAVVTEIVVRTDGSLDDAQTKIYIAVVDNKAKLVYEQVGSWLEGRGDAPTGGKPIADQLKLQDEAAQRLRKVRHLHGALDLETVEANPVMKGNEVVELDVQDQNRARQLIEDLMIAANGATARYLENLERSSMRRVVAKPKRWDRIVTLAGSLGTTLPGRARCEGAVGVHHQTARGGARQVRRPVAIDREAARPRRLRAAARERARPRPLRPRRRRLLAFDRTESPLSRSDHAAVAEDRGARRRTARTPTTS